MLLLPSFTSPSRLGTSTWARAHCLVGSLQADPAQVDVLKRDGDVNEGSSSMHYPGVLHHCARLVEVRKQQDQPAPAYDDRQPHHAEPEPALFACVEAAGGDVLAARHDRPSPCEPLQIVQAGGATTLARSS